MIGPFSWSCGGGVSMSMSMLMVDVSIVMADVMPPPLPPPHSRILNILNGAVLLQTKQLIGGMALRIEARQGGGERGKWSGGWLSSKFFPQALLCPKIVKWRKHTTTLQQPQPNNYT
jgi:hypothetical protein